MIDQNKVIMKLKYLSLILLFIFQTLWLQSQVLVERTHCVYSDCLHRKVNYSIILPQNYFKIPKTYSVIYLLHGFGGDNTSWLDRCNINLLIDSLLNTRQANEYIYVLPDADNTYYINNYDSSIRYEDFFIRELIPHIDSTYRTLPCKEGRVLMGLSMGGFGSVILAVKHPDVFGSVIAMSASVRNAESLTSLPQPAYNTFFNSVFGPQTDCMKRVSDHWKQNSPYYLIDSTKAEALSSINWYVDCGMSDPLLSVNEAFHDLLMLYSIPHEFHMRPGNHNWVFWYHSFIYGLNFLKRVDNEGCVSTE
jgi:enterochelin esterase-like enzyme